VMLLVSAMQSASLHSPLDYDGGGSCLFRVISVLVSDKSMLLVVEPYYQLVVAYDSRRLNRPRSR
jgi:hypothetical protein